MTEMTLREREILIATFAMRIMCTAIEAVKDDWRPEDIALANTLLRKLEMQYDADRKRRSLDRAAHTDRRK